MKALIAALALLPTLAAAAPSATPNSEITRPADLSALTAPHSGYTFQTLAFQDRNGQAYRVFLGIPDSQPPATGYPVLYALDGNALPEYLAAPALQDLSANPPVLVLIGYPTDLRFDTARRAYDYTPPDLSGNSLPDQLMDGRRNGGAPALLEFIDGKIRPAVDSAARTDPARQTLWGHSYGGLFVLYTLFERPQAFTRYIAADPALWWQNGLMLHYAERAAAKADAYGGRSLLLEKSGKAHHKQPADAKQADMLAKRAAVIASVPADAGKKLVAKLRGQGLAAEYRHYPDLTHGGLLGTSFKQALPAATR